MISFWHSWHGRGVEHRLVSYVVIIFNFLLLFVIFGYSIAFLYFRLSCFFFIIILWCLLALTFLCWCIGARINNFSIFFHLEDRLFFSRRAVTLVAHVFHFDWNHFFFLLLWWALFLLLFNCLLVLLLFLLYGCQECVRIKINLLAKIVKFIFDFLQSLLLGHILFLDKFFNIGLLVLIDSFFLLIQHQDGLFVLVRIFCLQTLYRFVNVSTSLFEFTLNLSLLYNFVLGLQLNKLVNGLFFLLLESFKF